MDLPLKMPPKREFDAVGFGTNAVDYLVRVDGMPALGGKVEIENYSVEPGGEVASTMLGLQRLGLKAAYAGSFGDDIAGDAGLRSLEDSGVDVEHSRTIQGAKTQVGFILIDSSTGERTVLWHRDNLLAYQAKDAPVELAAKGRVLHMTPHDTEACVEMAKAARSAGTIVSLDVDNMFAGIEKLLGLVDICLTSEELPGRLTGEKDIREALKAIKKTYGCAVVGATLGASGSILYCDDEFVETKGIPVAGGCVDTTGAGDAFRTGFLYGVLSGESIEECSLMANAAASLKCRAEGARRGLPTADELQELLRAYR